MSTHPPSPRPGSTPPRGALRATAITLLCGLALLLGAGPAFAHAALVGSDPDEGASLDAAPDRISLEFNEVPQAAFSAVTVVGRDGTEYQDGEIVAEGNTLRVGVGPLGAAGDYEIGYRVISADGHAITGSVPFTLTTAGPAAATSTTAPTTSTDQTTDAAVEPAAAPAIPADEGGMPVWPWIVGAVLVVGGGVGAALRLGRG